MHEYAIERTLLAALQAEQVERRRDNLACLLDHLAATRMREVERRVATLSDDFRYYYWRDGQNVGHSSKAEARTMYEASADAGTEYELVTERLVMSDDIIVTEGAETLVITADNAPSRGLPADGEERWRKVARSCVLWAFAADAPLLASVTAYMSPYPTELTGWHRIDEKVSNGGSSQP